MRIVLLLITIQIGYITSKAVYPNSCDDSLKNDPTLEENEENALTKPEIYQHQANSAHYYKTNNNAEDNPSASKFVLNPNSPINTGTQRNTVTDTVNINTNNNNNQLPTPYPFIYKTVDPKLIITSQLYDPVDNRRLNKHNDEKHENIDETISIDLLDPNFNLTEITNDDTEGNIVAKAEETNDPDAFNIRELREHLLDHLLDYFLNILKEEQNNETVKRVAKDQMKVEDKLRNYYNPHHIDVFIDEDENLDYEDNLFNSPDTRRKDYKAKNKLEPEFYVSSENYTEYDNTLDVLENTTENYYNNTGGNDASSSNDDDDDFNINFNTDALHDSKEIVTAIEANNEETVSLGNTEKYLMYDEDSDEEVFKVYTNVVTTTEVPTLTTDAAVKDTTTENEEDSMEDDQIDDYMYNDDIDEYKDNKKHNHEIKNQNNKQENQTSNSDEDEEIPIKKNDNNTTKIEVDTYNDLNTTLANLNANNSVQLVLHLENVDSSQLDANEPVNTTQLLTILKKIKHDYKETGNGTTHLKHKSRGTKQRHCKKSILLNLNINVV